MAHDPSNPFHQLAKKISGRKQSGASFRASAHVPANGKGEGDSPTPATKRSRRDFPAQDSDDDRDAALFLKAVSGASPIRNKDRHASAGGTGGSNSRTERAQGLFAPDSGMAHAAHPLASRLQEHPLSNVEANDSPRAPAMQTTGRATALSARSGHSGASRAPGTDNKTEEKRLRSFHSLRTAPHTPELQDRDESASGEEDLLFAKAMQGVSPVKNRGRDVAVPAGKNKAAPSIDPAKALRDLLEGRLEFALHHTDEFVEGYVVGIDPLILARLRAGQFSPEAHLDLHGQNALQARDSLTWFIKNAYQRGLRTILIITGRGRNSPDGVGVLRPLLQRWLPREPFKRVVLAFCTAKSSDGGPGAIYILLHKYKKSRGKIIWEHGPSDDDFPDI